MLIIFSYSWYSCKVKRECGVAPTLFVTNSWNCDRFKIKLQPNYQEWVSNKKIINRRYSIRGRWCAIGSKILVITSSISNICWFGIYLESAHRSNIAYAFIWIKCVCVYVSVCFCISLKKISIVRRNKIVDGDRGAHQSWPANKVGQIEYA